MKRLILTSAETVAGLAALLSFKTHTHPIATGALPSAGTLPTPAGSPASTTGSASPTGTGSTTSGRSPAAGPSVAHSYTGQAVTTQYGIVQVKVTVTGSKITNVAFVQLTAFDNHSQEINSYAIPQLRTEALAAQSANIDSVSGATYTSDGYKQSLQSALDSAGL